MSNFVYIVFFTMIHLLKNCTPECTHYYLVLKEYFEDFGDGMKPIIEPTSIKLIAHEYPSFNITKEFKEMQNKNCVLELINPPDCELRPITNVLKQTTSTYKMGTDVHYTMNTTITDMTRDFDTTTTEETVIHYQETTVSDTTADFDTTTTEGTNVQHTTIVTDTTADLGRTTTEMTDTLDKVTTDVTDTSDFTTSKHETTTVDIESTTVDIETTTVDIDSTTVDIETTTETYNSTNGNAAQLSNDKKEVAKIVAISTLGATGTTALGYFIAMKIKHMLQYGAYHLTEPNPSLP